MPLPKGAAGRAAAAGTHPETRWRGWGGGGGGGEEGGEGGGHINSGWRAFRPENPGPGFPIPARPCARRFRGGGGPQLPAGVLPAPGDVQRQRPLRMCFPPPWVIMPDQLRRCGHGHCALQSPAPAAHSGLGPQRSDATSVGLNAVSGLPRKPLLLPLPAALFRCLLYFDCRDKVGDAPPLALRELLG
jgi:hypothetical protein